MKLIYNATLWINSLDLWGQLISIGIDNSALIIT